MSPGPRSQIRRLVTERLLPAALRWTPARFTGDDRDSYYARFDVTFSPAQRESLDAAVQSEAASWAPPDCNDALNFIADDVVTDSEAVRARLAEVVNRFYNDDNHEVNSSVADLEYNAPVHDELFAYDELQTRDDTSQIYDNGDVALADITQVDPPTADGNEELVLSQPIHIAMPLTDGLLLRKLSDRYPNDAFTAGMIRMYLYPGRCRPSIAIVCSQLQRLVDSGEIAPLLARGSRGRDVQIARRKYKLAAHTVVEADNN